MEQGKGAKGETTEAVMNALTAAMSDIGCDKHGESQKKAVEDQKKAQDAASKA